MPKHQHPDILGIQRLQYWLSQAAQDARLQAGVGVGLISDLYEVSGRTVERFEDAENFPSDPEWLLAAYAKATGMDDPRAIYRRALDLWYADKVAPFRLDGRVRRDEQFRQKLSRPTQRRDPSAPGQKPSATPKRRASS